MVTRADLAADAFPVSPRRRLHSPSVSGVCAPHLRCSCRRAARRRSIAARSLTRRRSRKGSGLRPRLHRDLDERRGSRCVLFRAARFSDAACRLRHVKPSGLLVEMICKRVHGSGPSLRSRSRRKATARGSLIAQASRPIRILRKDFRSWWDVQVVRSGQVSGSARESLSRAGAYSWIAARCLLVTACTEISELKFSRALPVRRHMPPDRMIDANVQIGAGRRQEARNSPSAWF